MLADNEIDIRMSRLAIWHTAWLLDQGARGTTKSSIAKVFCSEAIWRVVDRCVQVLGGQGVTGETLVERHLPRGARVPHLRRPVRGAPLVAGAAHRAAGSELVSEFDLTGKVCIVTGGGRGIGRAIAEGLARHGATLVLSGRTEATLHEAAAAIGERAGIHVADVAREADVLALRDAVWRGMAGSTCW